jgi:hypothetical protein
LLILFKKGVGLIALAANFDSGVGLLWPNLGPPHSASEFYMVEYSEPTHYVDIASTIQNKVHLNIQKKKKKYNKR